MRLSPILFRQHIDRMFKDHWKKQGQRTILDTGADQELKTRGITVYEPWEILQEKKVRTEVNIVGFEPPPLPLDENHPSYRERVCLMYRDHNVLLEGLDQAKIITKTVETGGLGLLESLVGDAPAVDPNLDKLVQRCIRSSHVFDAVQEKLPKLHDPERPAWNFPRVMGIPDYRRNRLLSSQLVQLCESALGVGKPRLLIRDGVVNLPIEKDGDLIHFELSSDLLLMSRESLPTSSENTSNIDLPDLGPVKHTITLEPEHFYTTKDTFPLSNSVGYTAHTAVFHYNPTQVKNIYETPVTETQILGRTLMKSFAVAAAQARQKYGDVKDLPEPITLQSVHTDGQLFHFMVYQLNTLDINGRDGTKNLVWTSPRVPLFSTCLYDSGRPHLTQYNPKVFQTLLAFYGNGLK